MVPLYNAIEYHPDAIKRSAVFVVVLTLRHVVVTDLALLYVFAVFTFSSIRK